jgi:alkaline phosphatase D
VKPELSRRAFLALGATVVAGACSSETPTAQPSTTTSTSMSTSTSTSSTTTPPTTTPLAADPFLLGVCAGDPDEQSAVLWTRLAGELDDEIEVEWEVAADDGFVDITARGTATARAADGHSVHAVAALDGPSWYRFRAGGFTSPAGRAAPTGSASTLRLATASCQDWADGFYAAHRDIAEWVPDLVVFLGDFIYENAAAPVADGRVRAHDGPEPTDLAGYRARYALYLSDPQLQASRAACPWAAIWDDHEVENNYAALTPQDPADAATFAARRAAAYRAWWEHMPVRLPAPVDAADFPIARSLELGGLVDLILLDGRQFRSDQACGDVTLQTTPPCPEALDPARTMLGDEQERWVADALAASSATWTVLGQQTVLTDLRLANGAILSHDQWDGYAPARDRLLAAAAGVDRLVVLTGDIHLAGVASIPGLGAEFVTTSISSSGSVPVELEPLVRDFPTVVDAELAHRGYVRHTVTPDAWTAEYRIVDDSTTPDSTVSTWRTFRVDATARDLPTAL